VDLYALCEQPAITVIATNKNRNDRIINSFMGGS
jgi:hypothetical protein